MSHDITVIASIIRFPWGRAWRDGTLSLFKCEDESRSGLQGGITISE